MSTEQSAANARLAQDIADQCTAAARAAGASSVIVMVGVPDGDEHSAWGCRSSGRTLEVRGLLDFGFGFQLQKLTFPIPPAPIVEIRQARPAKPVSFLQSQRWFGGKAP